MNNPPMKNMVKQQGKRSFSREEIIPIPIQRIHAQKSLNSQIEFYKDSPFSSFNLPTTTHHWFICQNRRGPKDLSLQVDNQEYELGSLSHQQVIYIPPSSKTKWEFSPADGSTHLLIPDQLLLAALPNSDTFREIQDRGPLVGAQMPQLSQMLNSYRGRLNLGSAPPDLELSDLIYKTTATLTHELLARHQPPQCPPPSDDMPGERSFQMVREFMWDNIQYNITLAELARLVHLSPFYFSRMFKEKTGFTPHQALLRIRVAKARTLLPTSYSLTEIAYRCGFSDQAHFTRVFKTHMGYTPSQFRKATI